MTSPPRELPPGVIAHANFPRDGRLRWLRWLDGIDVLAASGTPTIRALLTPLSNETNETDVQSLPMVTDVATAYEGTSVHLVHIGSLPGLHLGAVFQDGVHVGDLGMEQSGRLGFGHSDGARTIPVNGTNPVDAPAWWKHVWKVIPATRYPLGPFDSSFCVQFAASGQHLLVPCSEIFRVLCAPETRLANALLSGPWDAISSVVMNEAWSKQLGEKKVVGLRSGLTARSALPIAAYQWTSRGRQVASLMRTKPVPNRRLLPLKASIPYCFERIELEGEGVVLLDVNGLRRFLMLRITSVAFPDGVLDLPGLLYRLDNFNTTPVRDGSDNPAPPYTKEVLTPSPDPVTGKINVTPNDPPSGRSEPTIVRHLGPNITGLPPVERLELEPPRPTEERRRRFIRRKLVPLASTGVPRKGVGDVAGLMHAEDEDSGAPGVAFAEVVSALDELCLVGEIASWMPTVPVDAPWRLVGGFESWLLPLEILGRRRRFGQLRPGLARACLVAEIEVASNRVVHLLELQRRPATEAAASSEGFRLVLLDVEADALERTVGLLFRSVVEHSGAWPISPEAGRLVCLRHCYELVAAPASGKRVSVGWLGRAISTFCEGRGA